MMLAPPDVHEDDIAFHSKQAGEGTYCTCYLAEYRGEAVAIKKLKHDCDWSAWRDIKTEAEVLSRLSHPHIIGLKGSGTASNGRPFLVLERLKSTLEDSLAEDITTLLPQRDLAKRWPLTRALDCAVDLATALAHIHSDAFPTESLLHRDLKPANVGFTVDGRTVLFDFGLSKLVPRDPESDGCQDSTPRKMTGETGSERYMAPEVAQHQDYDGKADVYSFAMILFYMAARARPFAGYSPEAMRAAVAAGTRPKFPTAWPTSLTALVEACWHPLAWQRPAFSEVVQRLNAIRAEVSSASSSPRGSPHASPTFFQRRPTLSRRTLPADLLQSHEASPSSSGHSSPSAGRSFHAIPGTFFRAPSSSRRKSLVPGSPQGSGETSHDTSPASSPHDSPIFSRGPSRADKPDLLAGLAPSSAMTTASQPPSMPRSMPMPARRSSSTG